MSWEEISQVEFLATGEACIAVLAYSRLDSSGFSAEGSKFLRPQYPAERKWKEPKREYLEALGFQQRAI